LSENPQPKPKGGKRENSGAKVKDPNGEKRVPKTFCVTPSETEKLKTYLKELRTQPG
jgi:hypothetical protein